MVFIPLDVYGKLLVYLLNQQPIQQATLVKGESLQPIGGTVEAARGLPRDMFHLLVFAAREGLPLTSKGTLHKRTSARLVARLCTDVSACFDFDLKGRPEDKQLSTLAIIINMCLHFGLLRKEPNRYVVNEPELKIWLQRPRQQWVEEMVHFIIDHYVPMEPHVRHMIYAVNELGRDAKWHTDSEIRERLFALGWLANNKFQQIDDRKCMQTWLFMAQAIGLCDVGINDKNWMFRRVPFQAEAGASDRIFVQPDFEIILPPEASFMLRWELEVFAEVQSSDQVDIYCLTKSSLQRALKHKRTKQSVLSFLQKHAIADVPANVQDAIDRWCHLQHGVNIKAATSMVQVWADGDKPARSGQGGLATGTVYSSFPLQYDEMDMKWLDGDAMAPSFHDIPSLWTGALRAFHHSTKKEMVRTAIQRQLQLEVECGGELSLLLPIARVVGDDGAWNVKAYRLSRPLSAELQLLSINEWERIRLILPDVTI